MKVYCKKCKWRVSDTECQIFTRKNDHMSSKHTILFREFKIKDQNQNNDCAFFAWNWWSILS